MLNRRPTRAARRSRTVSVEPLEGRLLLATYFVAPNGLDTNPGTLAQPFQTISKAASLAIGGDVVNVRAGTYRETVTPANSGTAAAPIIYQPYNNEPVTISGADLIAGPWTSQGSGVWSAPMSWNYTADFQSNQVFVDGRMINFARWPSETNGDLVLDPYEASIDSVVRNPSDQNQLVITDAEFTSETAGRWVGAKVWVNLSRNGHDGQGQTGTVVAASGNTITVSGIDTRLDNQPWGVGPGTKYYLFDPTKTALQNNQGIAAGINAGEWWLDAATSTLYVATPLGTNAAGHTVEAKRRSWAFNLTGRSNIVVKGFDVTAASITTDTGAPSRTNTVAPASNITLDGIDFRYVTHFTDQAGNYQMQWSSKSGVILSGSDLVLKNSTIRYSAGSGLSILGQRNKVLNNVIYDVNYSVSEAGAVNFGKTYDTPNNVPQTSIDHEFAYNRIYNSPQQGINFRALKNSTNSSTDVRARIHHNVIHSVMLRSFDSAAVDSFGTDHGYVRIDHNVIYDVPGATNFGIYFDFASRGIVDHNLIYNVREPININWTNASTTQGMLIYNNTAISDLPATAGGLTTVGSVSPGSVIRNNIVSKSIPSLTDATMSNNLVYDPALFVDLAARNYQLKSTASAAVDKGVSVSPFDDPLADGPDADTTAQPDIGAFEFGLPAWTAGTGTNGQPSLGLPPVPAPPRNLIVTAPSTSRRNLTWTDASGDEDGFVVYRSDDNGMFWDPVVRLPADTLSYADTSLAGGKYTYSVKAVSATGDGGARSEYASASARLAGTWFTAASFDAWGGSSTPPVVFGTNTGGSQAGMWLRYNGVDFGTAGSITSFVANIATTTNGAHIYIRLGSPTGTQVADLVTTSTGSFGTYADRSTSVSGASGVHDMYLVFSSGGTANMAGFRFAPAAALPPAPPPAPTGLTATALSTTSVRLNWSNVSGETEYRIERSTDGDRWVEIAKPAADATTYTDSGRAPGTRYVYRVKAVNPSQTGSLLAGHSPFSAPAAATTTAGDTTPPTVTIRAFEFETRHAVRYVFSEDVGATLTAARLDLTNLSTGQKVPAASIPVTYDPATRTAVFTFPGLAGGVLPDANYRATLTAGITDAAGNALVPPPALDFYVLAGDFNRDRASDFADLGILLNNYNTAGKVFSQGDANYDGIVDFADLGILLNNYNRGLPAPTAPATTAGTTVGEVADRTSPTKRPTPRKSPAPRPLPVAR